MMSKLLSSKINKKEFISKEPLLISSTHLCSEPIWPVSPSREGNYLISGGSDGKIFLSKKLESFEIEKTYEEYSSDIITLAWNSKDFSLS
jgi:WD40 repeat protein